MTKIGVEVFGVAFIIPHVGLGGLNDGAGLVLGGNVGRKSTQGFLGVFVQGVGKIGILVGVLGGIQPCCLTP